MPFHWKKKNKVTRISQIVADLQSPKRGGSLVVETGFPTSLIDLFVKNRSRFKKPKSKNRVHLETPDPPPLTLSPLPPPPTPETLNPSGCTVACTEPRPTEAPRFGRLVIENGHGDDGVSGSGRAVNRVGVCDAGSDANAVLAALLKMFVVLVLIFSVKKLTVGVTMSAFSLLFLERAGCFRPCRSIANMRIIFKIKSLGQRVSTCIWFQKLQWKIKKNCEASKPAIVQGEIVVSELLVGAECSSNSLSFQEIEVVETKSAVGICCEETCFSDCVNEIKIEEPCEIYECEVKVRRSVKFKSMMVRKLVPKKFRGSRKEKREKRSKESQVESGSSSEEGLNSITVKEDKSPCSEIEEEQGGVVKDEEDNGNSSPVLGLECVREEVELNNKEKRVDRAENSGYLILPVIALAGLVVGRLAALLLTMTWCFMLKMVRTRGRSQNVPLIKCSIPKS